MKILTIESVDSTNDYIQKYVGKAEDVIVIAKSQTKGRGTKGRSFSSEKGGIYLSYYRLSKGEKASDVFRIMVNTSMSVVKTLKAFGVNAGIKWPNDIYVNGKKICGMLIENKFAGNFVAYSVIGIGLNVENDLPDELKDIAVSLKDVTDNVDYDCVLSTLIYNLTVPSTMDEYKAYSVVLGKTLTIDKNGRIFDAVAVDITDDGELKLDSGEILSSAEVKIREF